MTNFNNLNYNLNLRIGKMLTKLSKNNVTGTEQDSTDKPNNIKSTNNIIEPHTRQITALSDIIVSSYSKVNIKNISFRLTQYTEQQLTDMGLSQEDIEKYFTKSEIYTENGKEVRYQLRSSNINGTEVTSIEEAVKAISDEKINTITNDLYEKYQNGDIDFKDLKAELEKAGAKNVRFQESNYGKVAVYFEINGQESYILNNRPDFKVLTYIDADGHKTTTAEGVTAKRKEMPDEGTYGTRDLLSIMYGLSDNDIAKYFTPTLVQEGHFVTFVLNEGIEINGKAISTIAELQKALQE